MNNIQWEHLVAGISGGVISTLAVHPLELIKIRLQVNDGTVQKRPIYTGTIDAARKIFFNSGMKGLFQGIVPSLWGAGASWGFYFFIYSHLKRRRIENGIQPIPAYLHMWMASQAGIITLFLTNPIWVTKTRMCLQYENQKILNGVPKTFTIHNECTMTELISEVKENCKQTKILPSKNTFVYRGMVHCLYHTAVNEGFRGLYKGFLPGIFGVSHGALQFMAYEELKKYFDKNSDNTKLTTFEYLVSAALSKIFATSLTYPYQVLRSRLQDQHRKYDGLLHVIKDTYRHESIKGFYKGLVPCLLKVTPACCITFIVYENIVLLIKS